ncbi:hypothetical protein DU002_19190 [Corallincola holothuriorum]|uniref:Uncharacterized protein n=1 Tax=Corallincola holothuriorum TaxID=2282215 RepID=A0A368MY63_9GAMM|nr:hypothetical protein [Corallincola holothuriorum]RCU42870.1 hypothetical protein DU002_19190 [Corallincola holothuriorum]
MDMQHFKKVIYDLAQRAGFTVVEFHGPLATPNFFAALMEQRGKEFAVLASINSDWAVVSEFEPSVCELDFIDSADVARELKYCHGIDVISSKVLNGPFVTRSYLSHNDVKYWKPQSLGEALFNWWD